MPDPNPDLPPLATLSPDEEQTAKRVALTVLTLVLLLAVALLQRPWWSPAPDLRPEVIGTEVRPPEPGQQILFGKLALAIRGILGPGADPHMKQIQEALDANVVWPPDPLSPVPVPDDDVPAAERFRVAVLAGETLGPEAVHDRLGRLEGVLAPESPLHQDAQILRTLYPLEDDAEDEPEAAPDPAAADPADQVPPDARDAFVKRHGWFAELALTNGKPDSAFRRKAVKSGTAALVVLALIGLGICAVLMAGVGLLITGFVLVVMGRLRPSPPPPVTVSPGEDSLLWLETVAAFLGGFLLLKLVTLGLDAGLPDTSLVPVWVSIAGQWLLLLTILWPVARGMSFRRWRDEIGWRRGRGVFREMGAGLLAYVAALPVYVVIALLVVLFVFLWEMLTDQNLIGRKPADRVTDLVSHGGPLLLLLVFLLATVWAPIVEESIFRGALYRHLRARWPFAAVALATAAVFAVLHGYLIFQLVIIAILGVVFALMREWRGSLIPSATAHWIHNTVVLIMIITVMSLASP